MFSRERAVHVSGDTAPDITPVLDSLIESYLDDNELCAGFLCLWNRESNTARVVASHGIPRSPFVGTKKDSLDTFVQECLRYFDAPHSHKVSGTELWREIAAVVDTTSWHKKACFVPAYAGAHDFVFLGFGIPPATVDITEELCSDLAEVIRLAGLLLAAHDLESQMRVLELYVKEVGHDIASSVQAVVPMLRNIRRGLIAGPAAIEAKIKDAEEEIMSAYRTAETLGITVDPDYNIAEGNAEFFDARTAVGEILELCRSEASERHLVFRTELPENPLQVWGDRKAIQSALMQLLINAIKYSRGSAHVTIRVENCDESVVFQVTDRGMPIEVDEEPYLWDFGWRGQRAKELHVNGSGIGLYTVKKIVRAHQGFVGYAPRKENRAIVSFYFGLPKPSTKSRPS